ncbi:hydrophobic/amphiphilic exporter-1, HAE1 family [Alteribacillus persepolensis]|uniref:Hydrophobic/amphiphilic exporter-1, HAE1 family n=1 Tax=Alteribacillus persepolensis TaxID=568899 RepID=A0A1G8JSJ9_9BACI|nr:efflux RND transporter permease subunit [Alteribacillus persepolensis]SDI33520.1 hydrophobic/amphiphilic exporter-1, HAE1 family [Alteribacillus persepolensis]
MKLSRWSVKRPVGVIMIVAMVIVLSITALRNLAIDLYPDMELPLAVVATDYSGAAPEDIEETVTEPIEDSVATIDNVDNVQSQSSSGSSIVMIQFDFGTDLDQAMLNIRESVDGIASTLPDQANDPSVMRFDPNQQPILWVGMPETMTAEEAERLAEDRIQPKLEQGSGVASVTIDGIKPRVVEVQLKTEELNRYGITANEVTNALQSENMSASAGDVESGGQDVQIRVEGEFDNIRDIENTLISLGEEGNIKVSDVAEVVDTVEEDSTDSFVNGQSAYMFSIMKQSDANTVEVSQSVRDLVVELNEETGETAELSIVFDSAEFIEASIDSVTQNLLFGALFAVLVLMLFLRSVRATLVIGISIPIAVVSTFALMYFTGETLNILTMGGLALGVGMMVDSSIVMLESIYKHLEAGKTKRAAAIEGSKEIAGAIVASTMTTLVVFLPLVFVEGIASELFAPLALTVSFALIASLIAALTIVPMLSSQIIKESAAESREDSRFTQLGYRVNSTYKRLLKWSLGHRKTVLFVTSGLTIASLALVPMIGAVLLPDSDEGEIMINVETPTASTIEETQRSVNQVWALLEPYDEAIATTYSTVGGDTTGMSGGNNIASVNVSLVDPAERSITTSELISELSEQVKRVSGAEISVASVTSGAMGQTSPVSVSISGEDIDVLETLAEEIAFSIEQVPGTTNVETTAGEGRPQIEVNVDREQAAQYGLSYQDVMSQVMTGFNGEVATQFREDGQEIDVEVILPEASREQLQDIRNLRVSAPNGSSIPLSSVAELRETTGPTQINRQDQQRQVDITSDVLGRTLSEVSSDIEAEINQMNLPDGYSVSFGGESEDMQEAFFDLTLALVASIFLVYGVMAIQFESFVQPFIIMFSMPATLIGVLFGLFITQTPLSITAFIGVIMLVGVVVNNAIVMVDYINQRRDSGLARDDAILEAGPARLRPILMTVLTTVLAMIPVALGIGEGAEAQAPMGIVVIFGLLFSTLFTLVLIPVVYAVTDNMIQSWKRRLSRIKERRQTAADKDMS